MQAGKNKRRQFEVLDTVHQQLLSVDSQEEIDCLNWLCEAHNLSVINDFSYQPDSFQLFDPVKYYDINNKPKTLFREHIYTADFVLSFCPAKQLELAKEFKISYQQLTSNDCSVYIDCKGTHNRNERSFSYNQKWVWQCFKTYIYKLVPKIFFKTFGVPADCLLTQKTKKVRKMFEGMQTLKDYINSNS